VFGVKGDDSKFDYRHGGNQKWTARIDSVRLERLTPARVTEWQQRRIKKPVGRLSTQDDACFDTWWGTAKQRLLEAYPKPEGIPELTSLVTAPSRKIYPSVMRQAIFRKLQSAFRALANKPG
jgi:hypothetical protein